MAEAADWLGDYQRFWEESLDRLEAHVEDMKREEKRNDKGPGRG
jgi:hypothetical protein